MRKLFIFFIAITLTSLSSCDNKDNKVANSSLKTVINGVEVSFDTFKVEKEVVPNDGNPYTDLVVTATKSSDATKRIYFRLGYLETGADTCYYFYYKDGDIYYNTEIDDSFSIDIAANTTTNLKGTFTGTLKDELSPASISIVNGSFDITH